MVFASAVVAFALLVIIWPQNEFLHHNDWLDLVPWGLSIVIWALGAYRWFTSSPRARWWPASVSILALGVIVLANLFVALVVSCTRGVCL